MTLKKRVSLPKKSKKDRHLHVLLSLIELYIQTGKPIGSNTLKEYGFQDLSSATIRNYFSHLERQGFLAQQHLSGGRAPTDLGYQFYAKQVEADRLLSEKDFQALKAITALKGHEISQFLNQVASSISSHLQCVCFLSYPKFDHDFVADIKFIAIDTKRCLCILITDFGSIYNEIIYLNNHFTPAICDQIQAYCLWRLQESKKPTHLKPELEAIANDIYNEVMMRYISSHQYSSQDSAITRTGLSRLLQIPEFSESTELIPALNLFEHSEQMKKMLKLCIKKQKLTYWIGSQLNPFSSTAFNCSVITIPYFIHQKAAGAIGILSHIRFDYKKAFANLSTLSLLLSESLTSNIYKYQISFKTSIKDNDPKIENAPGQILLEHKAQY